MSAFRSCQGPGRPRAGRGPRRRGRRGGPRPRRRRSWPTDTGRPRRNRARSRSRPVPAINPAAAARRKPRTSAPARGCHARPGCTPGRASGPALLPRAMRARPRPKVSARGMLMVVRRSVTPAPARRARPMRSRRCRFIRTGRARASPVAGCRAQCRWFPGVCSRCPSAGTVRPARRWSSCRSTGG